MNRFRQNRRRSGILAADENNSFVRAHCVSGQSDALEQQMRPMLHEHAIFEGARLAFVGVADDILDLAWRAAGELPFQPSGEGGATAPDQTRGFYLGDHLVRRHVTDCAAQGSVVAVIDERLRRAAKRRVEQHRRFVTRRLEVFSMPFAQ